MSSTLSRLRRLNGAWDEIPIVLTAACGGLTIGIEPTPFGLRAARFLARTNAINCIFRPQKPRLIPRPIRYHGVSSMHYRTLDKIKWIFRHPRMTTFTVGFVTVAWLIGFIWTLGEAAGVAGSPKLLGIITVAAFLAVSLGYAFVRSLQWTLLFGAVKTYVRENLLGKFTKDTILIGIGPGGAIAVGMVAKAVRSLGATPPLCLVIDLKYVEKGSNPIIGTLVPGNLCLPPDRCFII